MIGSDQIDSNQGDDLTAARRRSKASTSLDQRTRFKRLRLDEEEPTTPIKKPGRSGRMRLITLNSIPYASISDALDSVSDQIADPGLVTKNNDARLKKVSERLIEGWLAEQAFGFEPPPLKALKGYTQSVECDGKRYDSLKSLAQAHGLIKKDIYQRLSRGWSPEAAVGLVPPAALIERLAGRKGMIYCYSRRTVNWKYVGISLDHARRNWQHGHLASSKAKEGSFAHALAQEGMGAFDYNILEEDVAAEKLPAREREWISRMGSMQPNGFNKNRGGVLGG